MHGAIKNYMFAYARVRVYMSIFVSVAFVNFAMNFDSIH